MFGLDFLNKLRSRRVLFVVGAIMVVVLVGRMASKLGKPNAGKTIQATAVTSAMPLQQSAKADYDKNLLADISWGPDPFDHKMSVRKPRVDSQGSFIPPTPSTGPTEINYLHLDGVTVLGTSAVCVIDGHVLRKGDSLNGHKVVSIQRDKVLLDKNGETKILKMSGD
ncbi:MAG: hypothetical protein QME66_05375 [Candidatus Eisenbacteria bacterium]|nr:hypothetical protein [Candidatus Eisenbacteria bacterium]